MLIINNLTVSYEKGKNILKNISLSLQTGQVHGLVGLNGAGKTTLLNTLYGFIAPESGSVDYNGQPLKRKDIGYLEATNYFYPNMTGYEYLKLFPENRKEFNYSKWAEAFSLPLRKTTDTYSTGMCKKLALLAIIKQDKPVIILDEPFNGLDLESVQMLLLIIAQLRSEQKTLIITSHIFETLTGCCDRIHYLAKGEIQGSYQKEEFSLLNEILLSNTRRRWDKISPFDL
ncbi:MAG: ATP-binding cassette domain-containing protein [Tannerellaceae bacterium]|nr:ATP-binding cassette domain-containing protein [Tannerellaceae bacterium]